jgi:hypothetical protein
MHEKHYSQTDFQMIKIITVLITIIILICSLSNSLSACEYNVRETGFADFEVKQYHFYGYVNRETPADIVINFERACLSIFKNCNIVHEIINVEAQQDHSALRYISQYAIHSFPSAVLVSPDSQVFVIPFPISKQLSQNTIKSVLERIVDSPLRSRIIDHAIKTYGVIFIIEGAANPENERIRKSVKQAIRTIQAQMKLMPKSIEHPPELIVLKREDFQKEELLLWSLGLDSQKIHDTYAAIIYGKARWIGPLLKGEEINKTNLTNILNIIGMDCECGLDMRVMQGTKLPVKWDGKTHTRLVKHLGFDPENPVIKLEMNRILRKGLASSPGAPRYYQSHGDNSNNQDDPLYVVDDQSYVKKMLYYLGFLSLLVIICGLLFILNKRRRS